ncbi:biopolymer transporter ExbD [cf. Phormidesmis sp. LEGE 11477]|uniref:ExbD/TolR family protein n=1 Tax=cf. Phormidesmis sp. LEGE 11477 TaxID=1828680 RepID=UPI00187E518C|nr:biopolymer transporter ExbD [cf. Phormidesmis sp. LEGE 11477]MBE9060854.1 biopolymer transporter ExbD [cf. Phormidesmis sp. LEGE 11477]
MRLFNDDLEEEVSVNILPMIDVIFAILSYFIISSLFLTRADGLPINLPNAQTSQQQPDANFTISVDADGQVTLNQSPIQISEIQSVIEEQLDPEQAAVVTIRADEAASHGEVVGVMDEVRQIEDARLAIATRPGDR